MLTSKKDLGIRNVVELSKEHYQYLEKLAKEYGVTKSEMFGRIIRRVEILDERYNVILAKIDLSPESFHAFMLQVQEKENKNSVERYLHENK